MDDTERAAEARGGDDDGVAQQRAFVHDTIDFAPTDGKRRGKTGENAISPVLYEADTLFLESTRAHMSELLEFLHLNCRV